MWLPIEAGARLRLGLADIQETLDQVSGFRNKPVGRVRLLVSPARSNHARTETVGNVDFYLDLLFYHRALRRLVAIDLKLGQFEPAHKGQNGTESPMAGQT